MMINSLIPQRKSTLLLRRSIYQLLEITTHMIKATNLFGGTSNGILENSHKKGKSIIPDTTVAPGIAPKDFFGENATRSEINGESYMMNMN
jgi:hypothetical protein